MILHLMSRLQRSRRLLRVDTHKTNVGTFLGFSEREFVRPMWPLAVGVQWVWQSGESYTPEEVLRDLTSCFELGVIEVAGSQNGSSNFGTIPSIQWGALQLILNRNHDIEARWKGTFRTAWTNLRVKREDFLREFPILTVPFEREVGPRAIQTDKNAGDKEPRRRGPKIKYDWSQFAFVVVEKLKDEGGLAPVNGSSFRQSDLETYMRSWCDQNWERTPGESTIREHVGYGIRQYETANLGQ